MKTCLYCESEDIKKNGYNHTKNGSIQKYKCHSCKHIFNDQDKLPNSHITAEIANLCIDLYVKGLSLRIIKQQILEQFEIKLSHVTVYNTIQQYSKIIEDYTKKQDLEIGAVWQIDETLIQFKGKKSTPNLGRMNGFWLWVCIDTKTRYVLGAELTINKLSMSGEKLFKKLKGLPIEPPSVICTDNNPSYRGLIKNYYPTARHLTIKKISIKPNTSFIERLNGTIKNRTKTMRGFEEFESCQKTLNMFMAYYNYLRPHMGLDQKTPAQKAGIETEFPQRWTSLIRRAQVASNYM